VREIQLYIMNIEKKIMTRDSEEKNEVLLMDVREAFHELDPLISEEQLNKYVCKGMDLKEESAIVWTTYIDYSVFLKKLKKCLVKPTLNFNPQV
jgi:hypothetical protein